ncbi:hypothetical protein BT63DRAFT_428302 [Microthyrium microscopicum]|uniref:CBM-cenC domain-containing protein n=1 Tax=Microthyrium microscopicum TaxID=703497 RepID=A0A6A6U046_9PEZI|nr:hypothetical protein BT63DRAFT_428302 [Microthyrium microscopicum]
MKSFAILLLALGVAASPASSKAPKQCVDFCNDSSDTDTCVSQAKKGLGQCYTCGPFKTISSEKLCDGNCVDINTDNDNCGDCEQSCGSKKTCQNGRCVKTTSAVPTPTSSVKASSSAKPSSVPASSSVKPSSAPVSSSKAPSSVPTSSIKPTSSVAASSVSASIPSASATCGAIPADPTNVVINGDFESGCLDPWQKAVYIPLGYEAAFANQTIPPFSVETTPSESGNYNLHFTTTLNAGKSTDLTAYQPLALEVGATYTLSAWAKSTQQYLNVCIGNAATFVGSNAEGSIDNSLCQAELLFRNPITTWTYQSTTFVAQDGTILYLTAGYYGDIDLQVDNVKVVKN